MEVQLPAYRDHGEQEPEDRGRADWRQRIASWMFWQARDKHQEGRPYEEWDGSWKRIGASGLPGELTWDEFVAARSGIRRRENIANTRPLELITVSGGSLFLPRAYAALLDCWEQVEEGLVARARICKGCAAQGPRWGGWRTQRPLGYATLCPPCSGAAFQRGRDRPIVDGSSGAAARRAGARPATSGMNDVTETQRRILLDK
ncbi:hypothetical protein [Streptomyces cacaoi]|uniref:hypothetical protein n=1 Tax=Streptomyces cacaoi TaxID=1898 RepID=UPI00374935EC